MDKIQKKGKTTCELFASDYHFEMISLPYIEKNLQKDKEVIILTENDLENSIEKVLSNISLDDNKKKRLFEIDWNNNDLNKYKKIKQNTEENKEQIIFIKGHKNYVENISNNIEKWTKNSENTKVIDCYDMQEVSGDLKQITSKYENILTTTGELFNKDNG